MAITASLDLYGLLVEGLFGGSMFFTIVGLTALLAVWAMFTKQSMFLMISIIVMFLLCMFVGFFGSIAGVIVLSFSAIYFFASIVPWIRGL